VKGLLSEKYFE